MYSYSHKPYTKTKYLIGAGLIIVLILLVLFASQTSKPDNHVIIVLSPHFDDAVLSLGGFMAKHTHPTIVASFFTAGPTKPGLTDWDKNSGFTSSLDVSSIRTKENDKALRILNATAVNYNYPDFQYRNGTSSDLELEREVAKDIQALLASYSDKIVDVYGPAIFTPTITHPDHALLHQAYFDVENMYPQKNVTFYIYEDYPYVEQYEKANAVSVEKNLENTSGLLFDKTLYYLSSSDLRRKEEALKAYASQIKAFSAIKTNILTDSEAFTKSRCGNQACEVAYKIFRATE